MKSIRNNLAAAAVLLTVAAYGNNNKTDKEICNEDITASRSENPQSALLAAPSATITVYGSGGYNTGTGAICPDQSSDVCAYIITESHADGSWGPVAAIEMWDGTALEGMIDEPIEAPDGEVINFVFSSLHEL